MTRGILSVKRINYKGIRLVLLALLVMGIYSCASFGKEPSTKAATIEVKILSESVDKGDITKIQEAIQAGADVNVRNKYDATPLLIASRNGHTEIVKLCSRPRLMLMQLTKQRALLRCGLHRETVILKSLSCSSRLKLMSMQLRK